MVHYAPYALPSTFPDGTIQTGADGHLWMVWRRRWVKFRHRREEEVRLDACAAVRPFRVRWGHLTRRVLVDRPRRRETEVEPIFSARFQEAWIGYDPSQKGTAVLLRIRPHYYVYIGSQIYSFWTSRDLQYFTVLEDTAAGSPPRAYAGDGIKTYFLEERVALPQNVFPIEPTDDAFAVLEQSGPLRRLLREYPIETL